MNILRRFNRDSNVELVERDGKRQIVGYAAIFYDGTSRTEFDMGTLKGQRIIERVFPSGIDLDGWDTLGLYNHDRNMPLGRRSAGTMRLEIDKIGLKYTIDPPDADYVRNLFVSMERRDVQGSSFGMHPEDYARKIKADRSQKGIILFNVDQPLRILDVGPVTEPAYTATTAELRSLIPDVDALSQPEPKPTNTPEQTRRALNEILAADLG